MAPTEKRCAKCQVIRPSSLFNAFARNRDGLQSYCKDCMRDAARKHYHSDIEASRRQARAWAKARRVANPEKVRASDSRWRQKNPEKAREHDRIRYYSSPERQALAKRRAVESNRKHAARHNFNVATRRATAVNARPAWAIAFFMREAYHLAALRTKITGFDWQVDHAVPLRNKIVSGLHAHTNLQVIPRTLNARKHNCYWPDMP